MSLEDPFFQEGYCDAYEGIDYAECPYEFNTDGEYGWKNGWKFAEKEIDNMREIS